MMTAIGNHGMLKKKKLFIACQAVEQSTMTIASRMKVRKTPLRRRGRMYGAVGGGGAARPARPRGGRGPRVGQVVEQAREVAAGLGGHGPADPVVELGLVEAAVGVVHAQLLGDRVPVRVGDADVLVGVADAARPLLG